MVAHDIAGGFHFGDRGTGVEFTEHVICNARVVQPVCDDAECCRC
jgi:hypothetical protein